MGTYEASERMTDSANYPLCERLKRRYERRFEQTLSRPVPPYSRKASAIREHLNPFEPDPAKTVKNENAAGGMKAEQTPQTAPAPKETPAPASGAAAIAIPVPIQRMRDAVLAFAAAPAEWVGGKYRVLTDWIAGERSRRLEARGEVETEKAKVPWSMMIAMLVLVFCASLIIYSFAGAHVTSQQINELQKRSRELTAENNALNLELEERENIANLREIAEREFNMVEGGLVENFFFSVTGGGKTVVFIEDAGPEEDGVFAVFLDRIKSRFDWVEAYFR